MDDGDRDAANPRAMTHVYRDRCADFRSTRDASGLFDM
jgi:hypothetical protein